MKKALQITSIVVICSAFFINQKQALADNSYANQQDCTGTLVTTTLSYTCTGTQDFQNNRNLYLDLSKYPDATAYGTDQINFRPSNDGDENAAYTIVAIQGISIGGGSESTFTCENGTSSDGITITGSPTTNELYYAIIKEWHCTGTITASVGDSYQGDFWVVPYDTRTHNMGNIDWTQPSIIAGFFLMTFVAGLMIHIFKK